MAAPGKRGEVPVEWENRMEWENYGGESEEAEITNAEAGEGEEEEGKPVAGAKKDFWSATDKTEEGREEEREKDKKLPATEQDPQQTPPSLSQSPAEDPGMYTSDNAEGKEKDEWEDAPQEPPQKKEEREKEQQLATEQQTLPSSYSQPQTQELCPRDEDEWGDAHQKPSGNSSSESSDEDRGCGRWWSSRGQSRKLQLPRKPSQWSSRDTARYRDGYPGKGDYLDRNDNHHFYTNQIQSRPNGDYIDNIHSHWWGKYDDLEWNHSYIQWLFPIRERGMNWEAQELQPHEIEAILVDEVALDRVMKSYEMMLDFYGMRMKSKVTGELERTPNYKDRFQNLNRSSHNYLRITRILKCLGEFGLEYLKAPFIEFVLHEAIETQELRNTLDSCMCYWVEVLRITEERERLWELAREMVDKVNKEGKKKGNKKKEEGKKDGKKEEEGKKDGKEEEEGKKDGKEEEEGKKDGKEEEEGKKDGKEEEEGKKDGKKDGKEEEEGKKDGKEEEEGKKDGKEEEEGKKDGKKDGKEEEERKEEDEGKGLQDSGASQDPQSQSNGQESANEDQANGQNSGQSGTVVEGGEDDGRDK